MRFIWANAAKILITHHRKHLSFRFYGVRKKLKTFINWKNAAQNIFQKAAYYLKYLRGLTLFLWRRSLPHLKKFHFNTFPAVRLRDFNRLDLALKFSSELMLLALAALVVGVELQFAHSTGNYADQSHAAKIIAQRPELNQKLYARMSVINTVVLSQSAFVPAAQAEEVVSLTPEQVYQSEDASDNLVFSNDTIVQPNPDSVQQMLAKQIKVYQTQEGDTLKSIAEQNGISANTIMWANKLTSTTIKPGWFLIILPTSGILHKASSNDTLPDIAKKYSVDVNTIISYNGLENAEDISAGDLLIIPGGKMPEPPKPKTPAKNNDGKVKSQGVQRPAEVDNGTGHLFPWGYCTWYVASKVHVPWGGNAKAWLANASAAGATIINHAVPGAIVVTTDNKKYGHVALVESVNEDGFVVSEMNYQKFGKVNTRFIPHGSRIIRGFIVP